MKFTQGDRISCNAGCATKYPAYIKKGVYVVIHGSYATTSIQVGGNKPYVVWNRDFELVKYDPIKDFDIS